MRRRLVIVVLLLLIIFSVGILFGILLPRWLGFGASPKVYTSTALVQQVKTLSQLITVQYVIEKVVVLEDVKWVAHLGESRVLMVAHGIVKAGMDFSQLESGDIQISGKKLTMKLPPARVTDVYLDEKETRVVERSTGLLRAFDKDLEQTARQNAVSDIGRAARNGGILKDAEQRARAQLTNLFLQLGFETVEFRH